MAVPNRLRSTEEGTPLGEGPPLLKRLWELSEIMNHSKSAMEGNLLNKWQAFQKDAGEDCTYTKKCESLFLKYDYERMRDSFLLALEEYRKIEGEDFGRE